MTPIGGQTIVIHSLLRVLFHTSTGFVTHCQLIESVCIALCSSKSKVTNRFLWILLHTATVQITFTEIVLGRRVTTDVGSQTIHTHSFGEILLDTSTVLVTQTQIVVRRHVSLSGTLTEQTNGFVVAFRLV